eukprot:4600220-Lingulodinium_polyedra.AAC.1
MDIKGFSGRVPGSSHCLSSSLEPVPGLHWQALPPQEHNVSGMMGSATLLQVHWHQKMEFRFQHCFDRS